MGADGDGVHQGPRIVRGEILRRRLRFAGVGVAGLAMDTAVFTLLHSQGAGRPRRGSEPPSLLAATGLQTLGPQSLAHLPQLRALARTMNSGATPWSRSGRRGSIISCS